LKHCDSAIQVSKIYRK